MARFFIVIGGLWCHGIERVWNQLLKQWYSWKSKMKPGGKVFKGDGLPFNLNISVCFPAINPVPSLAPLKKEKPIHPGSYRMGGKTLSCSKSFPRGFLLVAYPRFFSIFSR